MQRVIGVRTSSRAGALAIGVGVLVVGGILVVVGATILLTLGVAAAVIGTGVLAWRRLTGRAATTAPLPRDTRPDPSLEIFPASDADVRRLPPSA